ncbi:MarR family transcriptional regulator [Streptomyces somaliensis]|uniref:MarR family winged helix-turn-helix transcriptional regulator n=1 Tax=Streptomyces somaliensis TaxID=78355 RepID=UPI0020CFDE72|nr:MarR family transcriptional regulator [Streptomyces somaliensis]MCP9946889.1 MarR family transcriptional regulator [Streptomyces somaliensis]MCP9963528.1 MarR family transcriptional regulator [Streptomyces somaliensis]MCP9976202.1 MarR family transcriptional regulator [Streptomyces somaliensis]
MDADPTPFPYGSDGLAARVAVEVVESLEVLWEHGRGTVAPRPVSATQLRVLYALEREEGINLRTLSGLLGSTPSSVSRLCDRLEALGFVERLSSSVSRRELELRLTSPARACLDELRAHREEVLTTAVAAMRPSVRAALLEGLHGLRASLEDLRPARPAESGLVGAEQV